jgi:hypothetical protein
MQHINTKCDDFQKELVAANNKPNDDQERLTRALLVQDTLKSERDMAQKDVQSMQTKIDDMAKVIEQLRLESSTLRATNAKFAEVKAKFKTDEVTLSKIIQDLETEKQVMAGKILQCTTEKCYMNEQLGKETQKVSELEKLNKRLQNDVTAAGNSAADLRKDLQSQTDKFNQQLSEFSKMNISLVSMKTEREEDKKKISELTEVSSSRFDTQYMGADEKKRMITLQQEKDQLMIDMLAANNKSTDVQSLLAKIKQLENENDDLEWENSTLVAKQAENTKLKQTVDMLMTEKSELSVTIDDLQKNAASSTLDKAVQDKIRGLEDRVKEWEILGAVSTLLSRAIFQAHRKQDMHIEYEAQKKAVAETEQLRKVVIEKDQAVADLQQRLKASGNTDGVTRWQHDAVYWKAKYEAVIARF